MKRAPDEGEKVFFLIKHGDMGEGGAARKGFGVLRKKGREVSQSTIIEIFRKLSCEFILSET